MSKERYQSVLLFGAPGSGKGTQGKILGSIPGFFHLSSGDVFRSLDANSPDGKEVSRYSARGELVPDDLTIKICRQGLERQIAASRYHPQKDLLLLDGIPRNVAQAEILDDFVDVRRVVYLVCSDEEEMVGRIKGRAIQENRTDDANDDVVRRRFQVYREETAPVLDHYAADLIVQVDAIGTPAQVLRDILDCVIPIEQARLKAESP